MAQDFDAAKRRMWSDRLGRFAGCGLTVADDLEGVSTASFYEWRRKLNSTRRRPSALVNEVGRQAFVPVHVVAPIPPATSVEIELPNGARVNLASPDAPLIAAAIAAAGQVHGLAREREGSAC